MLAALCWASLITATEGMWRWCMASRARAWQLTALSLLIATTRPDSHPLRQPRRGRQRWTVVLGLLLSVAGYPFGRLVANDHARVAPRDSLLDDLLALTLLAMAEERAWAGHVATELGPIATAILFAIKHPLLDHRWRRVLGLALFWIGLSLVRQRSPRQALHLHLAINVLGVLLGHASQRDQF